jgi:outer membrane protein assembly factor BamD
MSRSRLTGGLLAALLATGPAFGSLLAQEPATTGAYNEEAAGYFQQAQDWEAAGDTKRAIASYRALIRTYPLAPSASAAQFRLGELYDSLGNSKRAFESYQKLLENYPQSREFDRAVEAQAAIADATMDARRYDRAAEMYTSIVATAPFARFAPEMQFKLGQALESQKEYDKAIEAYQVVLDRYPTSSIAADALYQIGYVQFTEAQGRSQDLSAAIDAKNTFEEFLMEFPKSEKAAQARENLDTMSGREAFDLLSIAKYYDRNSDYRAAVVYYSDLVRRQPGTPDADIATARIEEIRATVGEDELRAGGERAETGARAAMRRRLQNQVQTSSLSNYAGPPVSTIKPPEELPAPRPQLRTSARDVRPQTGPARGPSPADLPAPDLPPVEPDLPSLE